jgi:hypothetical protein
MLDDLAIKELIWTSSRQQHRLKDKIETKKMIQFLHLSILKITEG